MKTCLDPFLKKYGIVILDGALATELERLGAVLDDSLWSASILMKKPELIRQVHLDYFLAGADVATTASYQATFEGFEKLRLSKSQATDMMRLSVQLACEARDEFWSNKPNRAGRLKPLVAASVGPYGAFLADGSEYRGDYGLTVEELMDFHRPRMAVLASAGADLLAFETIPCMEEGVALVKLLAEFPGQTAWLSFSCRDEKCLNHGEPIEEAVVLANHSDQIIAVGVNCTSPVFVEGLLKRAAYFTEKPLLAYPNSGEGWDAIHKCWLPSSVEKNRKELALRWKAAGAKLLGGCCRTTPADIRKLTELRTVFH
jgi:homocysteine S-methyltransferase